MIERSTINRILETANIVDVISDYITLKKAGSSYKGLCPFHDDRTPSFSVSPVKGVYKCFACGEAGNVVNFIMKYEQLGYIDALKILAKKYHIEIKEHELTPEERKKENERESLFLINEWATKYFHDTLKNNIDGQTIGLQYLRSRGFRDDIIEKFQLGFCLSNKQSMTNKALKTGFQRELLLESGLCFERDNGELVDRFYNRVIFPWFNISGKIIAFGGRLLDSRTKGVSQKYINSPGNEIYQKDHALYGISQAKRAIGKYDLVYMVEGYTDVISMHQCGIENVVANSGTALSVFQIKLIHRFTKNIVLLYDGDEAGQHAALRGTDMLLAEGMNVKVLLIPDGKDPDELSKIFSAEEFRHYIENNKTDFILFKINVLLKGVTDPVKRSEAINSIVQSIAVIKDSVLRDTYLRETSQRIGINEQTLITQMNKFIYNDKENLRIEKERELLQIQQPKIENTKNEDPLAHISKVEIMLLQAVIRYGEKIILHDILDEKTGKIINFNVAEYINYDLGLDNLSFSSPISKQILQEAVEHGKDLNFNSEDYFTHHSDINISTIAVKLSVEEFHLSKSMRIKEKENDLKDKVMHLILDFRKAYIAEQLETLKNELKNESNYQRIKEIMDKYKQLKEVYDILAQKLGNDIIV